MNKKSTFIISMLILISGILISNVLISSLFANTKITAQQYGPIKKGDTLWQIATTIPIKGINRLKMMRLLHQKNPHAFLDGNINRLKIGSYLTLPSNSNQSPLPLTANKTKPVQQPIAIKTITPSTNVMLTNKALPPKPYTMLKKLQLELSIVTKELNLTKNTLKGLQKENLRLKNSRIQQQAEFTQRIQRIKNNQTEQVNSKQALMTENTRLTLAYKALTNDINTLKNQIIELEVLQKMKDAHITELKKALNYSSTVIKKQNAINLQIHQRMNALESKLASVSNNKIANLPSLQVLDSRSLITSQSEKELLPSSLNLNNSELNSLNSIYASRLSQISSEKDTIINGKFWLIFVIVLLLLILAFFWRSFFNYSH